MKIIATASLLCIGVLAAACSDSIDSRKAQTALLEYYPLSSPDSVPEGVAFDTRDRAFYATSLQGGSIVRVDADGAESEFRAADNRARLVGAKVDSRARRLWVCAQGVDGIDNRVWVFDLESAATVMEFLLGALSTDGSCNDLVLDADGVAYVTDPANPFVYRLDPVTEEGSVLATDPLFTDVTGAGLGLNGIVIAPGGSSLVVARFAPPGLLSVSMPDGKSIAPITLSGDELPSPDGLVELNGDIYAVSNASVSRVRLRGDLSSGEVVTAAQPVSGLSTATVAESALFVIKSEVFNFVLQRPLETPFSIFSVDLEAFDS